MLNFIVLLQLVAFFSFGIGASDLSIFFLAIVAFVFLFRLKLQKSDLSSLLCIVLVFTAFAMTLELSLAKLLASLILIMMIYSISSDTNYSLSTNTLFWFSIIWFIAVVATIIQKDIFNPVMYRVGYYEGRGVSGLTAEPSLLGTYSAMYFGILTHHMNRALKGAKLKMRAISKGRIKIFLSLVMMGFSVIMSASMLGFLFFLAILVYFKYYKLVGLGVVVLISLAVIFSGATQRIFILVQYLVFMNFEALSQDHSIWHRLNSFLVFINPSIYEEGRSLSAGLSPLVYLFGWPGQILVIVVVFLFKPFRSVVSLGFRSLALTGSYLVMFIVGPLTIIPFWLLVALERRRD